MMEWWMSFDEPSRQQLRAENRDLKKRIAALERALTEREARISLLERRLIEAVQRSKRQAAPFRRDRDQNGPRKKPGRKSGLAYGRRGVREAPARVDERVLVQCPVVCPQCQGGPVELTGKVGRQVQIDIPKVTYRVREFELPEGRCLACGRLVQGRHPLQTSDAVNVGSVHLGANVIALAAHLNKMGGLSYGKIAGVLSALFELKVAKSTLVRALQRLSRRAEPTYEALSASIRASPVAYPDETGWRIDGRNAWLWVATDRKKVVFRIESGRGFEQAKELLGEDFSGVIGSDGWPAYRLFTKATRQACLAHLLRRCSELREALPSVPRWYVSEVACSLKTALALRDLMREGLLTTEEAAVEREVLEAGLDELLGHRPQHAEVRRLFKHLRNLRGDLFTFLDRSDVEATNWPAEQAIRPAVVNRKNGGGGNRSTRGARVQAVLMSVLHTAKNTALDSLGTLASLLRSPRPVVLAELAR